MLYITEYFILEVRLTLKYKKLIVLCYDIKIVLAVRNANLHLRAEVLESRS